MAVRRSGTSGAGAQRGAGRRARQAALRRSGGAGARMDGRVPSGAAWVALRGRNRPAQGGQNDV